MLKSFYELTGCHPEEYNSGAHGQVTAGVSLFLPHKTLISPIFMQTQEP